MALSLFRRAAIASAWVALAPSEVFAQSDDAPAVEARAVAFNWVRLAGAESCSPAQVIARQVRARLGGEVFVTATNADWSIEGRIERRGRSWVATIAAARAPGETAQRTIERIAPDCAAIDEQVVTVIALMLDANSVRPQPVAPTVSPTPAPPQRIVERGVERVEVPVVRVVEREPRAHRSPTLELSLGGAYGALPQSSFAARFAGEFALRWPIVRLRAALWFNGPSLDDIAWGNERDTVVSVASGASVGVCISPPSAPAIALCPAVSGGVAAGFGNSDRTRRTSWLPVVSIDVRAQGAVRVSRRWSLGFWSEVGVGIVRPRFVILEDATQRMLADSVARSPLGVSAGLSLSLLLAPDAR